MTDQEKFEQFLARKFHAREAILKSTPAKMAMRVVAASLKPERKPTKLELAVAAGYPFPRVAARLLSRETLEAQKK